MRVIYERLFAGGARVIRGLPVIGRPNAHILHRPATRDAHGQEAVGVAEVWPYAPRRRARGMGSIRRINTPSPRKAENSERHPKCAASDVHNCRSWWSYC